MFFVSSLDVHLWILIWRFTNNFQKSSKFDNFDFTDPQNEWKLWIITYFVQGIIFGRIYYSFLWTSRFFARNTGLFETIRKLLTWERRLHEFLLIDYEKWFNQTIWFLSLWVISFDKVPLSSTQGPHFLRNQNPSVQPQNPSVPYPRS